MAGRASNPRDDMVTVPIAVQTRIFGDIHQTLTLPIGKDADGDPAIAWDPQLVFPGLQPGEKLTRRTRLPTRATLRTRDGKVIAQRRRPHPPTSIRPPRRSPAPLGPAPPERAAELDARGVPDGAPVGLTGLEREFDAELAGTPGGELRAGSACVASRPPQRGKSVRTTIDPDVQRAAVDGAGRPLRRDRGGASAHRRGARPRRRRVLGAAAARLDVQDHHAVVGAPGEGGQGERELPGADGGDARGREARERQRRVVRRLADRLVRALLQLGVRAAGRQGRRAQAGRDRRARSASTRIRTLAGAARSTIPAADEIGDDLAVGSTAIGQGKVLATPLEMALVAAAIGEDGMRVEPDAAQGRGAGDEAGRAGRGGALRGALDARGRDATAPARRAAMSGVKVAGKTGTAELRTTVRNDTLPQAGEAAPPPEADPTDTDAWFAAFAPPGTRASPSPCCSSPRAQAARSPHPPPGR